MGVIMVNNLIITDRNQSIGNRPGPIRKYTKNGKRGSSDIGYGGRRADDIWSSFGFMLLRIAKTIEIRQLAKKLLNANKLICLNTICS
jgi:hypothetical protein